MINLILGLVAGLLAAFAVPLLLPERHQVWLPTLRILGMLFIIFAVASTSYVHVPDGYSAHLFRIYGGGSLPEGRIVAANGENGPQARILPPGFHIEPLINVLYSVDTGRPEVAIPQGKVGLLTAKDGAPLRAGQAYADPFPKDRASAMINDAALFLKSGGQRGPQANVLTPGRYRLNHYLWDVDIVDAVQVPAGFVGVIKSNVHADVDFGTLKAARPENCDAGQHIEAPIVPVGCIGVWEKSLQPGEYYLNANAYTIINVDTRALVWTYAGGYQRAQIALTVDPKGDIVQNRSEVDVPVDKDNADRAIFLKMEGWDVPLELRVVAWVAPNDAPCVVARIGTLKQVENRVLTPSIRAVTRDVAGGTYEVTEVKVDENGKPVSDKDGKPIIVTVSRPTKVLDLINQRPLIESEIERRIRPAARMSCITIREVRLGEPAIPPELLVAVRREQLATQLAKAFTQEQSAQAQRVVSEKAKATADQQGEFVRAEIEVQRSVQLRQFELLLQFAERHPEAVQALLNNAHKVVPQITVGQTEGLPPLPLHP
jgi:hypothetical protein